MVDLSTTIASLQLNNPTISASGVMDEDAGSMHRIIESGAGALVTKSIGLEPREGYPNPTLIELDYGVLNAMGLPNPGMQNFREEIIQLKQTKIPIIGSIFGKNAEEFAELGRMMEASGVAAIELNLSCPHAKGYGTELGSDPQLVSDITSAVKQAVTIPVLVKLSPNVHDIVEIAHAAEHAHADGIVAINTLKAMKIDLETHMPVLSNKVGGYSGKAIKPVGIRCVYEISETVDLPVIGVGGITTGENAIEYLMAGATAVQIGTGMYYRGVDVFSTLCHEMEHWMKTHGYSKVSDIIGVAHQ